MSAESTLTDKQQAEIIRIANCVRDLPQVERYGTDVEMRALDSILTVLGDENYSNGPRMIELAARRAGISYGN